MCGITGFVNRPGREADREIVARMTATLAHRGPDGDGIYVDGPAALGHRRLSIIDVAGGGQPMSNEDGSVWVTYNGELYNEPALRARARGASTIVIAPPAIPRASFTCMKKRGRNSSAGSTGCSRWRSGTAGDSGWCSRATAWAKSRSITRRCLAAGSRLAPSPRRFSHIRRSAGHSITQSLARYLFYEYVPAPGSIWRSIRKLPGGHRLDVGTRVNSGLSQVLEPSGHRIEPRARLRRPRPSGSGLNFAARSHGTGGRMCRSGSSCRAASIRRASRPRFAKSSRHTTCDTFSIGFEDPSFRRERPRPRRRPLSGHGPPRADFLGEDGL